jgi:HPt (histidine-containing phosphotransfer) domain-containing protein
MSDDHDELIRAAFAELHVEFASKLPERVRVVAAAIRAAEASRDDAELRAQARGAAHRLRGSAGSYGFPEISATSARIEEALIALATTPSGEVAAAWSTIVAALDELERAAIEG